MNKAVTINISGIIFYIEEDAFDKLSNYLKAIKLNFNYTEGSVEILNDIESRIAEMLQSKISKSKQVILVEDVDFVIKNMGKPEEFKDDSYNDSDVKEPFNTSSNTDFEYIKKRLYRDTDSKVLGGVCSGIAKYMDMDVVWLRVILLCMFFIFGTGLLLYLILWIAIPEAKTTAEKLAMKGEKIDINNISKTVKEEAEQFKKKAQKFSAEFEKTIINTKQESNSIVDKVISVVGLIALFIARLAIKVSGFLLIILGVFLFLLLFTSVFGFSFFVNTNNGGEWIDLFLLENNDFYLSVLGLLIFIGVPIIMMIYVGIKMIFKLSYPKRWINLTAGLIWFFGFMLLFYLAIKTGSDFSKIAKVREYIPVKNTENILYLKMHQTPLSTDEINLINDDDFDEMEQNSEVHTSEHNGLNYLLENSHLLDNQDYLIGTANNVKYILGHAKLTIIKSQTSAISLIVVKEAKGNSKQIAADRAKNISYAIHQTDSIIEFDNLFKTKNNEKFRFQDITIILKLPVGQVIYLDKSLENLIYDIENVSNTYDKDMVSRKWMMTENGLKCMDCDGLQNDMNDSSIVNLGKDGININSSEARIKLDSNGIRIMSKDSRINIDRKGIHLKAQKD